MKRTQGVAALVAGVVIVLALLTVFAIELSDNQSSSRRNLETQAHQRAQLVAGLVDAVYQQQARIGPRTRARFGGTHITRESLERAQGSNNAYVVVLDAQGRILAHSSGFSAKDRATLDTRRAVQGVTAAQPWRIGDLMPGNVVDMVSLFPTPHGNRVLVTGMTLSTISTFVQGELRKVPGNAAQHQILLDRNGVVLASTYPNRPAGYVFHTATQRKVLSEPAGVVHASGNAPRYFDRVPLGNTHWQLVLSVPSSVFYATVSGIHSWLPWVIFGAFGVVALVALMLIRRSIRAAARIRRANAELSSTNAELSSTQASLEEAADALATSNSALERSNDELERQARELVRSNTELDQFASIASHDLQEPLRKVRTFTERISETEASNLTERGADYLRRANASAERMQILIEDLLRFSRVSTQGRPFTRVDLNAVARDVLDDLSAQVERSGAEVRIGPLPTINADGSQMRQLLQNLISNALKFQREGVTTTVVVEAGVDSGWLTMTVADNGIGFDPQYSRRIFRVFERLHGRGTYPGTGIGLALCRKIAERHGGTIVAAGVADEGATFTVTMQTERTEAVSDAPAPGRATDRPGGSGPNDREEPYVTA